jgi:hypothetical protein
MPKERPGTPQMAVMSGADRSDPTKRECRAHELCVRADWFPMPACRGALATARKGM